MSALKSQADPTFPEILLDLYRTVEECMVNDIGLSQNEAREAAKAITDEFWDQYAGFQIYVPVGRALKLSARNQEIYNAYVAGKHKNDIMREYAISNATFYAIIRRAEFLKRAAQLDLFPSGAPEDDSND